ncbi:MAG: ADP-ribosylglycohydrolase family protein [Halomonadaceae bacterium]|nr:MAG: ADP-ribosylglycohydrolase family protein [Halomonadaceae bacterium]
MQAHPEVHARAAAALRTQFVADSLAMPVHWFYNVQDIENAFPGGVRQLEAPPEKHPSSIMSLHSTHSGGRKGASPKSERMIVGDVILKGKRPFWDRKNMHYHQGMVAGDNTLNAHCTLALMQAINTNNGHYDQEQFLDRYIALMTSEEPAHPDTYAESYHRGFFANLEQGMPRHRCAAITHDTPSVGGLVSIAAIVFAERLRGTPLLAVQQLCHEHLYLTHPDDALAQVCASYVSLLDRLLFLSPKDSPRAALLDATRGLSRRDLKTLIDSNQPDREVIGRVLSPACYISDAWPAVLYLACKYSESPLKALQANANVGGDNVHRGAVLGVLLGLINGGAVDDLFNQLTARETLQQHIDWLVYGGKGE